MNNAFVTLGGAGWETQGEWEFQWQYIYSSPLGSEDPAMVVADKLDQDGERVDEKFVRAETVESLLDRPLAELIAEGRAKTPFTLGELMEIEPEMAEQIRDARVKRSNR
ncbi:hypothetical protein [Pseudomonas costantinii]|uniref:hypothetical protein n=1 Tax=Pseudomonas costantinii TaxID=168469 RepID=UPI0015A0C81C|nr:hypothetical protein [Pseudomonas costantinii]NVZ68215.1 hypothetical protein [Pseudomonas costantinii]